MKENWNVRLKECRNNKNIKLRDLESRSKLDLSQQSLIKYEKGEIYPRIDVLEKMCKIYGTSIEYIMYGTQKLNQFEERSNSLVTLFMLMYSDKIEFNKEESIIEIKDKKLLSQINMLNNFKSINDISSIDDLYALINGINKIESEK